MQCAPSLFSFWLFFLRRFFFSPEKKKRQKIHYFRFGFSFVRRPSGVSI